jgi:hypothetical protein
MLIDSNTQKPIYNENELQAQENEKRAPKAIHLTPQENTQEEAKQRQKEYEEKAKQKKWTKEDLTKLAFNYKIDSLGNETLLSKEDHEKQGDPAELQKDIKALRTVLLDEKRTITLEGIEKNKIIDGVNFLYWLVLDWHIMSQWFVIQVVGNEPKILPAEQNPTIERQGEAKKMQEALSGEWGQDFWYYTDIKKWTKTAVLSNYIATEAFHRAGQKGKSLETYRSELEKMIGGDWVTPLDEKKILDSSLNGQQKSFLLSWSKRTDDTALRSIADHETKNVINANKEWNKKSELEKKAYLRENGLKSSLIYVWWLALMAGLLVAGIKTLKDGSWWKKILLGIPAVLIGGSFLVNKLQAWFNEFWGQNILEPFTTARPTDKKNTERNKVNFDTSIIAPVQEKLELFQTRFSGSKTGIDILLNQEVGQKIATEYPVYSMLSNLNPDERTIGGDYEAPDITLPQAEIESALDKLETSPNQKVQLNTLLTDTWERYQDTEEYKKKDETKRKQVTLDTMLAAIELEDGWLNSLIDPISSKPEKDAAMRVIGQNPKQWWSIKVQDLHKYFVNTSTDNVQLTKLMEEYSIKYPDGWNPTEIMKKYLTSIDIPDTSELTLREFLEK